MQTFFKTPARLRLSLWGMMLSTSFMASAALALQPTLNSSPSQRVSRWQNGATNADFERQTASIKLLPNDHMPTLLTPVMPREAFSRLIDEVAALYDYDHGIHGKDTLEIDKDWDNTIANAEAWQGIFADKRAWGIRIWGGLARVPGMTEDALSLLVCHEFGHQFGGGNMGYTGQFQVRLQTEGGSDYYAAGTCAKRLWANKDDANLNVRRLAEGDPDLAPAVKLCSAQYSSAKEQNICVRTIVAGYTVATKYFHVYAEEEFIKNPAKLAAHSQIPSLSRRDTSKPDITLGTEAFVEQYPTPQCRLDLFVAGALCPNTIPSEVIPGWDIYEESWPKSDLSVYQEDQAMLEFACKKGKLQPRPRCYWLAKQPPEDRRARKP